MVRVYSAWVAYLAVLPGALLPKEKGPAPRFLEVTKIGGDAIELKELVPAGEGRVGKVKVSLGDVGISDVGGKRLTADDFRKRARVGSVVLVAADERAVDPAYLGLLKEDTLVLNGVFKLGPGWTMDLKKMKSPDAPLSGTILGAQFKPTVRFQGTGLSLQSGKDNIHIFLRLKPGQTTCEYGPENQPGGVRPAIHLHIHSTNPPGVTVYTQGYAMRVEFGKEQDGKIPGKLYLCLPDDRKSYIAGSFTLDFP